MARKAPQQSPDILNEMQLADVQPPAEKEPEPKEEQHADEGPAAVSAEEEVQKAKEEVEQIEREPEPAKEEEPSPEKPTIVDPARFAAMEQSLTEERTAREREKTAMLREIVKLRRSRQQDEAVQQQVPQPAPRIPVEFDEQGQPYVSPEALARVMGGNSSPADAFMQQHRRMAESLILQDPVNRSKAHQRFREAYDALDEAIRYEQITQNKETPDMDSMMELIEGSGLVDKFTKEFPEIAMDARDIEDFLQASVSLNPRRLSRVLDRIAKRS